MGGRIHGFLGGVLLTASLTYYTGQYIEKKQHFISDQLRRADDVINNRILSDKGITQPIPVDNQTVYQTRTFGETAKDIWNDEVISAVNWLYSIDWYKLTLTADRKIHKWTTKIGESINDK